MPQGSINPLSEAEPASNQSGVLTVEAEAENFIGNSNLQIKCKGNNHSDSDRICSIKGTNESDKFYVGGGDDGPLVIFSMNGGGGGRGGGGVVDNPWNSLKVYGRGGDDDIEVLINFPDRPSVSLAVYGGEGKDRITVGTNSPRTTIISLFGGPGTDIFVLKRLEQHDWPSQKGADGLDHPPCVKYLLPDFSAPDGEHIDLSAFPHLRAFEDFPHSFNDTLYITRDYSIAISGPVNKTFSDDDFIFYRPNLPEANGVVTDVQFSNALHYAILSFLLVSTVATLVRSCQEPIVAEMRLALERVDAALDRVGAALDRVGTALDRVGTAINSAANSAQGTLSVVRGRYARLVVQGRAGVHATIIGRASGSGGYVEIAHPADNSQEQTGWTQALEGERASGSGAGIAL